MKIAIVGLLVGTFGAIPCAFAADWKAVQENDKFVDYMDKASVKRNENIRKVWELRNYKSPRQMPGGKPYSSMKSLNEYDCKNEKKRVTYVVHYSDEMGNGSNEGPDGESPPTSWVPVIPETVGEVLFNAACSS